MLFEEANLYNTYRKMRGGDLYEATAQTLEKQIKGMGSRPVMGDYGDSNNEIRQMNLVFSTPEEAKRIASEFNSSVRGAGASIKKANWGAKLKDRVIAIGHNDNKSDKVIDAMSKKPMQLNKIALEIAKNTTDQYAYAMGVETDFDEEVAMDTERFAYGGGSQKKLAKAMEQEKGNVSVPKENPKPKKAPKAVNVKLTDKEKKKFDDIYQLGLKDPKAKAKAISKLTPDEFKKFVSSQ